MASRLLPALDDLVDTLTAAGVPASLNPGEIPVPGAWVSARDLTVTTLAGGLQVTVHVWLVVHDAEERDALRALELLLEAALEVLPVDTTNGDAVQLASTLVVRDEGPLPAFQITTTVDI